MILKKIIDGIDPVTSFFNHHQPVKRLSLNYVHDYAGPFVLKPDTFSLERKTHALYEGKTMLGHLLSIRDMPVNQRVVVKDQRITHVTGGMTHDFDVVHFSDIGLIPEEGKFYYAADQIIRRTKDDEVIGTLAHVNPFITKNNSFMVPSVDSVIVKHNNIFYVVRSDMKAMKLHYIDKFENIALFQMGSNYVMRLLTRHLARRAYPLSGDKEFLDSMYAMVVNFLHTKDTHRRTQLHIPDSIYRGLAALNRKRKVKTWLQNYIFNDDKPMYSIPRKNFEIPSLKNTVLFSDNPEYDQLILGDNVFMISEREG